MWQVSVITINSLIMHKIIIKIPLCYTSKLCKHSYIYLTKIFHISENKCTRKKKYIYNYLSGHCKGNNQVFFVLNLNFPSSTRQLLTEACNLEIKQIAMMRQNIGDTGKWNRTSQSGVKDHWGSMKSHVMNLLARLNLKFVFVYHKQPKACKFSRIFWRHLS